MKQLIRFAENIFTVGSLMLFSQGFFLLFLGETDDSNPDQDNLFLRMVFQVVFLITFCLLTLRWKKTITFVKGNLWLVLLIVLTIFSISWSSVPDVSFRKVVAIIGTTFFGLYLGTRYSFEERIKIMSWAFGISIVFNYLFIFLFPKYGIMQSETWAGAWRGIYTHKNGLGENMFISFLTFYILSMFKSERQRKGWYLLNALLSVVLIFFGKSATAFLSVLFIFGMVQVLKRLSLRSKKNVLLVLITSILGLFSLIILFVNFTAFLEANNKDITLSGRLPLWGILWNFIQAKIWFGYGYGSFFGASHEETQLLWTAVKWGPVHAHNGYVQLCLHLGLIGCSIFVIGYFYSLFKSLFLYLLSKDLQMLWTFSMLTYSAFSNITEVSFFGINSIAWIVCLSAIASLHTNNINKKLQ
jgi:exopolysaccharide production protein ExoQ